MNKIVLLFAVFLVHFVGAQEEEYTWDSIHEEFLEKIESQRFRYHYKGLLEEERNTEAYVFRRLHLAWLLGKLDDVYDYIPKMLEIFEDEEPKDNFNTMYQIFGIDDQPLTEWRRNGEMIKRVLKRFEESSKVQEYFIPLLIFIEHYTGQWTNGVPRAEEYLTAFPNSYGTDGIRSTYIQMLLESKRYHEVSKKSHLFYQATNDPDFLQWYCQSIYAKGDLSTFLLLEDTVKKYCFYFQYFNYMEIHSRDHNDEAMQFYIDWFEDSITIGRWSHDFMIDKDTMAYRFRIENIKTYADYQRVNAPEKACEIYAEILKSEEKRLVSEWAIKNEAEFFLAKVGTESEQEWADLWIEQKQLRKEIIESCEYEVQKCE